MNYEKIVGQLLFNLQNLLFVFSFFISIYSLLKVYNLPILLKLLCVYTSINFLITIFCFTSFYLIIEWKPLVYKVYTASLIFHYLFFGLLIQSFLSGAIKIVANTVGLLTFIILFIFVINYLNNDSVYPINLFPYSISCFGLLFFSLTFFYYILNYSVDISLLNNPVLWVIIGVFISSGIQFPFVATFHVINHKVDQIKIIIYSIAINLSFFALHFCIIKAFLCSIKNLRN